MHISGDGCVALRPGKAETGGPNHLSPTAQGYCFELSEVWSDRGKLLATAELIRAIYD